MFPSSGKVECFLVLGAASHRLTAGRTVRRDDGRRATWRVLGWDARRGRPPRRKRSRLRSPLPRPRPPAPPPSPAASRSVDGLAGGAHGPAGLQFSAPSRAWPSRNTVVSRDNPRCRVSPGCARRDRRRARGVTACPHRGRPLARSVLARWHLPPWPCRGGHVVATKGGEAAGSGRRLVCIVRPTRSSDGRPMTSPPTPLPHPSPALGGGARLGPSFM